VLMSMKILTKVKKLIFKYSEIIC